MTLTLALTTFNRYELLKESFAQVITDPRIDEILISDDESDWEIYTQVNSLTNLNDKIKVTRQLNNRGMGKNKADVVALSKNDFVVLFDSDNVITPSYLDALPDELFPDTIYMPSFARPEFNFRQYEGLLFDRENVGKYIKDPPFNVLLNCCNYVVPRLTYGEVYKFDPEVKGADTIAFNYRWLEAGYKFYVVPGMEYTHKVHRGSEFMKHVDYNMRHADKIKKMIMAL